MQTTPPPLPASDRNNCPPPPPPDAPADPFEPDDQPLAKPLTIWRVAEATLKHPVRVLNELHTGEGRRLITLQLILATVCLAAFGVTVGTYSMGSQLWLAPAKITLGVLGAALICLPSLFVFSCLAGADSDPGKIAGALTGLVTVASLLLVAFGPVSWIFAQSTGSILFMGVMNLAFWLIALAYGLQYLKHAVVLLNGRSGSHLLVWTIIFVVVTLQMTTTLRPILGTSDRMFQTEKKFFLTHWVEQMDAASRAPHKR